MNCILATLLLTFLGTPPAKIPHQHRMMEIRYSASSITPGDIGALVKMRVDGQTILLNDNIKLISLNRDQQGNQGAMILLPIPYGGTLPLFTHHPDSRYFLIKHPPEKGYQKSLTLHREDLFQWNNFDLPRIHYTLPITIEGITPGKNRALLWMGKIKKESVVQLVIDQMEVIRVSKKGIILNITPWDLLKLLTLSQTGTLHSITLERPSMLTFKPNSKPVHLEVTTPPNRAIITLPPICNPALFQKGDHIIFPPHIFQNTPGYHQKEPSFVVNSTPEGLTINTTLSEIAHLIATPDRNRLMFAKIDQNNHYHTAIPLDITPFWLKPRKTIGLIGVDQKRKEGDYLLHNTAVKSVNKNCITFPLPRGQFSDIAQFYHTKKLYPVQHNPTTPPTISDRVSINTLATFQKRINVARKTKYPHQKIPNIPFKNSAWITLKIPQKDRYQLKLIQPGNDVDMIALYKRVFTPWKKPLQAAATIGFKNRVIQLNHHTGEITLQGSPEELIMIALIDQVGSLNFTLHLHNAQYLIPPEHYGVTTIHTILTGERIMELANIRRQTIQKIDKQRRK